MRQTVNELVSKIKRWGVFPTGQETYTDAEVVKFMNEEQLASVIPFITGIREEHFVDFIDYTIETDVTEYSIPGTSVGMSVHYVMLVDAQENERRMAQYLPWDKGQTGTYPYYGNSTYSTSGYLVKNNKVKLRSTDNYVGETLRIYFYRRPATLVLTSESGLITNVVDNLNDTFSVTINARPVTWETGADQYDINDGNSPYDTLTRETTLAINNATFTVNAPLPTGLAIGNYINLPGEASNPQIPLECTEYLCQNTVRAILRSLDYQEEARDVERDIKRTENYLERILSPRTDGDTKPYKGNPFIWTRM